MSNLIKPPPASGAEKIRQFEQRLRQLETKQTVRVGDWVIHSSDDGRLLVTKPGDQLDVGNPAPDVVDLGSLRGFVTEAGVAQAVSGGQTSDLSMATQVQVAKDIATSNAQYTAENAYTTAARIEAQLAAGSTGYLWQDTFNGAQDLNSIGPRYTRVYDSGGAGQYGLLGDGNVGSMNKDGSSPHLWYDLHDTPTNTDKQLLSTVLTDPPRLAGAIGATDSDFRMVARWDGLMVGQNPANAVMGYWIGNTAFIGCYVGGAWTQFGATSVTQGSGDKWDFQVGTDLDPYNFILLRNGLPAVNVTDPGHVSRLGAAYRRGGTGYTAGTTVFFWVTQQLEAPTAQSFNFADRSVGF